MDRTAAWFLLLLVGVMLVIVGFTGSLGKVFAVAFAPDLLSDVGGGGGGDFGTGSGGNEF